MNRDMAIAVGVLLVWFGIAIIIANIVEEVFT